MACRNCLGSTSPLPRNIIARIFKEHTSIVSRWCKSDFNGTSEILVQAYWNEVSSPPIKLIQVALWRYLGDHHGDIITNLVAVISYAATDYPRLRFLLQEAVEILYNLPVHEVEESPSPSSESICMELALNQTINLVHFGGRVFPYFIINVAFS